MESTTHGPECAPFHDDLASLAVGSLTGLDRARVLAHLEQCPRCIAEMEELSATADALTTLIPDADPPAGFADRTLDLIRAAPAVSRGPLLRRVATVAAVVVLLALGAGLGSVVSSSNAKVPASAVRTAPLRSSVGTQGTVLLVSKGHQGWLVMDLHDAPMSGVVTCSITLDNGARHDLGQFDLSYGYGSWSVRLPVAASAVRSVSVIDHTGAVVASARVS